MKEEELFVYNYLTQFDILPEIAKSIELIKEYTQTSFFERKDKMIANWVITNEGIYKLIISVFTLTLTEHYLTYQAVIGRLNHKINLPTEIERAEILADIIGLLAQAELINIQSQQGEYHIITTDLVLNTIIPITDKHIVQTHRLQPIENNYDSNYGSIILGDSINAHNEFINLSHINRLNNIQFRINEDFYNTFEECPKHEPETELKQLQWEVFKEHSNIIYKDLINKNTSFHIIHKTDSRGRTYAMSYYLGYQGAAYKKAIIELDHKEVIEGF